jgi:hypothetical protein
MGLGVSPVFDKASVEIFGTTGIESVENFESYVEIAEIFDGPAGTPRKGAWRFY